MTHSLHRRGSPESLRDDYVFICRSAAGINRDGSGSKLHVIRNILCDVGISNVGYMESGENLALGLTEAKLRADMSESPIIAAAVNGRDKIKEIMRRIKGADLGISITISGLIEEILPMCEELGIRPHTINLSLGVHGKTELLPKESLLQMTTMCGHALVSIHLAEQLQADVRAGRKSAQDAACLLAQPCVCGIVNMHRAAVLLQGGANRTE